MFGRGIKLEFLRRVRDLVSSYDDQITTQQVYEKFVQVWTQSSQLSLIDSFLEQKDFLHSELKISYEDSISDNSPNVFICHTAWSNHFLSFCALIEDYCLKLQKDSVDGDEHHQEIILWIDIFCINYWDSHHRHSDFLGSLLPEGLSTIGRTVLILPTLPSDRTLFSSTCLWEIFLTSYHLLEFEIIGSQEDLHLFQENLKEDIPSVDISISSSSAELFHLIEQFYQRHCQESPGMVDVEVLNDSSLKWFNQFVHATFIEWKTNQQAAEKAAAEMATVTGAQDGDDLPETEEDNEVTDQLEILSIEGSSASAAPQSEMKSKGNGQGDSVTTNSDDEPSSQLEGTIIEMGMERLIMFTCPYEECQGTITVAPNQINCGVFRHGVYKTSGRPVGAHLSQDKCLELVKQGKVYGCVQPFRIRKIPKPSLPNPLPASAETAESVTEGTEREEQLVSQPVTEAVATGDEELPKKKNQKKPKKKQQQKKEFRYFIEKCGYI